MKVLKIIGAIVLVFALIFAVGMFRMINDVNQSIDQIIIEDIEISDVKDGFYTGSYDLDGRLIVDVEVEVLEGTIINVEILRHENGMGKDAEVLSQIIVDEQSTNVDVISGATASSKVIIKACENALKKGL